MATNPQALPRRYYSLDEYFALEHAGDARYEYWNGDILCMSGGTRRHGRISGNTFFRLSQQLEGGPCQVFTADTAVLTPAVPPYRYPDASVGRGELEFRNFQGVDALVNPVLIVEVLSPTTETRDREAKFGAYQAITTFREYLFIAQDRPHVTHYIRTADNVWERRDVADPDASLNLESCKCVLKMADIYAGVTFP